MDILTYLLKKSTCFSRCFSQYLLFFAILLIMLVAAAHGIPARAGLFVTANINICRIAPAFAVVNAVLGTAIDHRDRKAKGAVVGTDSLYKALADGVFFGIAARHVDLGQAAKSPLIIPAGHYITH